MAALFCTFKGSAGIDFTNGVCLGGQVGGEQGGKPQKL